MTRHGLRGFPLVQIYQNFDDYLTKITLEFQQKIVRGKGDSSEITVCLQVSRGHGVEEDGRGANSYQASGTT